MAIPAAVGLGLSAISTVSSISSQNRAASRQEEQIERAAADAEQRIRLAQDEMQFVQEQAARIKSQELALNAAQRKSTQLQITQQVLNNELQKVQSKVQQAGIRTQASEVAAGLLTQANQQAAQSSEQTASQLRDLNRAAANPQQRPTNFRERERLLNAIEEARGAILAEDQTREGIADFNVREAGVVGGVTRTLGELASGDIAAQQELQNQLVVNQAEAARKIGRLQSQRNTQAIRSKYYTTSATANMTALSQMIQERENIRGLEAQRASIQRPGFLSYMNAAAGLFNQGMQLGLFTFGGNTPSAQPTQQQPYNQLQDVTGNYYG